MLGWVHGRDKILRSLAAANQAALWSAINIIRLLFNPISVESTSWFIWCEEKKVYIRKYELNVITYQSLAHLFYSIFYLMWACHHESKTRDVLWKVSSQECWLTIRYCRWIGGAAGSQTVGLKVCHGGGGRGRGGGGFALTARHMEGCRFPPDRENGILNAYLRCYRWRSQRQRILYKAFWKAPLIFHQNCVYTRKTNKKGSVSP